MRDTTLLTLADIVRATGIDRSALNRILELPENRDLFQGLSTHPQYPVDSLPRFHRLADLVAAKKITPKTLSTWWKDESLSPMIEVDRIPDNRIPDTEQAMIVTPDALEKGAEVLADALVTAAQRRGITFVLDRLVSGEEAAAMLNCTSRGVAYRVRPVEPGSYRLSDIQAYIHSLAPLIPKPRQRKPKTG